MCMVFFVGDIFVNELFLQQLLKLQGTVFLSKKGDPMPKIKYHPSSLVLSRWSLQRPPYPPICNGLWHQVTSLPLWVYPSLLLGNVAWPLLETQVFLVQMVSFKVPFMIILGSQRFLMAFVILKTYFDAPELLLWRCRWYQCPSSCHCLLRDPHAIKVLITLHILSRIFFLP